jgi:phage shock protein PspC (stress-responsive transcriptional regulator)
MTAAPSPDASLPDPTAPVGPPPNATPSWQQAPPPPAAAGAPRHLRRSSSNRVLGGVCGGLAEYSDTDALLWRIGFIAIALLGAGVLIYPLLWIILPEGPDGADVPAAGLAETLRNGRRPTG